MKWVYGFFEGMGAAIVVALVIAFIVGLILFPLAQIWALNTLFGLSIAYTFKTWLAALVLGIAVRGVNTESKKESK